MSSAVFQRCHRQVHHLKLSAESHPWWQRCFNSSVTVVMTRSIPKAVVTLGFHWDCSLAKMDRHCTCSRNMKTQDILWGILTYLLQLKTSVMKFNVNSLCNGYKANRRPNVLVSYELTAKPSTWIRSLLWERASETLFKRSFSVCSA